MSKKIVIILFIQFYCTIFRVQAQNDLTIPVYHWAYPYIHQLRLQGYFEELNPIQQPYTEKELLKGLGDLEIGIQQGLIRPTRQDQWLMDFLMKDFVEVSDKKTKTTKFGIRPGIWINESAVNRDEDVKFYTQFRSQLGFSFGNHLSFYNGIRLDQSLLDEPGYGGEKWRGFAGYMEQAYVRYTHPYFQFTLGRDFLNWGSGKTGRLLFSDYAQPLDQIAIQFKYKAINFTLLAADLDQWLLSDTLAQHYHIQKANRFLSAHRLTVNFKNKFYIGLTETLLYGGPNSNWELMYHNPLLYYHGELLNGGGYDGNGFLYLDFDCYIWKKWEFYGEILIDDLQLEKTRASDLEPNETGFILGFRHSDWFGLQGSLLGVEYVRIANRTYNSNFEWEKFVRFNRPIGYHLGNNFDRWLMEFRYFPLKRLQVGIEFDFIRKGEGSLFDEWDAPWMSHSVSEGYDEPFPYGIVEKSYRTGFNVRGHFRGNLILESQVCYQLVENAFHEIDSSEYDWTFFIKIHWNFKRNIYY